MVNSLFKKKLRKKVCSIPTPLSIYENLNLARWLFEKLFYLIDNDSVRFPVCALEHMYPHPLHHSFRLVTVEVFFWCVMLVLIVVEAFVGPKNVAGIK